MVGPKLKKSILSSLRIVSKEIPFVFVIAFITVMIMGSKIVINTLANPMLTVPIVESWIESI